MVTLCALLDGEAASLFFVRVLDGDFFLIFLFVFAFGRSVGVTYHSAPQYKDSVYVNNEYLGTEWYNSRSQYYEYTVPVDCYNMLLLCDRPSNKKAFN